MPTVDKETISILRSINLFYLNFNFMVQFRPDYSKSVINKYGVFLEADSDNKIQINLERFVSTETRLLKAFS